MLRRLAVAAGAIVIGVTSGCSSGSRPASSQAARSSSTGDSIATTTSGAEVQTPKSESTLLDVQGSGYSNTNSFTVSNAYSGWTLVWSYSCTSAASSGFLKIGNLAIAVYKSGREDTKDPSVVGTQLSGSGSEQYHDTGTFSLHIGAGSDCTWSVTVSPNRS